MRNKPFIVFIEQQFIVNIKDLLRGMNYWITASTSLYPTVLVWIFVPLKTLVYQDQAKNIKGKIELGPKAVFFVISG